MNIDAKDSKTKKLFLGLLFDAVGYVSFSIPLLGELIDIIWAPISAKLMTKMYKGRSGKVAATISFIEEALPGLDIIPTFTLMWIYTYVISTEVETDKKQTETVIDITDMQ